MHSSQPVHKSPIILCIRFTDPEIASTGQAVIHFFQPMHSDSSIIATCEGIEGP